MKKDICREYSNWLERLPRREPSPSFRDHMSDCADCRREYDNLDPIVERLLNISDPGDLSSAHLVNLTTIARSALINTENRKIAAGISTLSFLLLPLVLAVNIAWGYAGYELFAWLISPWAGTTFLLVFTSMAATILSVMYTGIPILAGWIRGPVLEDIYR